jgi:hypothetical protein
MEDSTGKSGAWVDIAGSWFRNRILDWFLDWFLDRD